MSVVYFYFCSSLPASSPVIEALVNQSLGMDIDVAIGMNSWWVKPHIKIKDGLLSLFEAGHS